MPQAPQSQPRTGCINGFAKGHDLPGPPAAGPCRWGGLSRADKANKMSLGFSPCASFFDRASAHGDEPRTRASRLRVRPAAGLHRPACWMVLWRTTAAFYCLGIAEEVANLFHPDRVALVAVLGRFQIGLPRGCGDGRQAGAADGIFGAVGIVAVGKGRCGRLCHKEPQEERAREGRAR
jgi:hypothetical protein